MEFVTVPLSVSCCYFLKGLDKEILLGKREGGSLLLQEVPLYPGAHTHVPSSGEQDPPF